MKSRYILTILLLLSCSSKNKFQPEQLIGKSLKEMVSNAGKITKEYSFEAYNINNELLKNYGYKIKNRLLVFRIINNRIKDFHQTSFIDHDFNPKKFVGLKQSEIDNLYGSPFHKGFTLHFDEKRTYCYFYKIENTWSWSDFKFIPNGRFFILYFKDEVVVSASVFDFYPWYQNP